MGCAATTASHSVLTAEAAKGEKLLHTQCFDKGPHTPHHTRPGSAWPNKRLKIVEENRIWIKKMDPENPDDEYYINKNTGEKTMKKPPSYDHIAKSSTKTRPPSAGDSLQPLARTDSGGGHNENHTKVRRGAPKPRISYAPVT